MRDSTTHDPPAFAQALLRALLDPRAKDVITGDLLEEYRDRRSQGKSTSALRAWYFRQVLSFVGVASLRRALLPGWAAVMLQACAIWMLPFLAAVFVAFSLRPFSPAPGIAAFFVCSAGAAFQASARTAKVCAGVAAAAAVGCSIALFAAAAGVVLSYPHPPLATFPIIPGVALVIGVTGGLFGNRFGAAA